MPGAAVPECRPRSVTSPPGPGTVSTLPKGLIMIWTHTGPLPATAADGPTMRDPSGTVGELVALRERTARAEQHYGELVDMLLKLCPCLRSGSDIDETDQACPLHGDVAAFVAQVRQNEVTAEFAHAAVTFPAAPRPDRAELVRTVRDVWPAHARERFPDRNVTWPAVRDGGMTAAVIDLAVDTVLDAYADGGA